MSGDESGHGVVYELMIGFYGLPGQSFYDAPAFLVSFEILLNWGKT